MLGKVIVGVLRVSLNFRHSRSLKDKRQIVRSLTEKLRNQGFSVGECGGEDNPQQVVLGASYVGHHTPHVEKVLHDAERLFDGLEIIAADHDVFDYTEELEEKFLEAEE